MSRRMANSREKSNSSPIRNNSSTTPSSATARMVSGARKKPTPHGPISTPAAKYATMAESRILRAIATLMTAVASSTTASDRKPKSAGWACIGAFHHARRAIDRCDTLASRSGPRYRFG